MHQEIVLGGGGQAFFVEPIERPRHPASVVVTSFAGDVHAATTSCEIDPVETTLAEPAPAGTTMLRLRSTTGIAPGTRYTIARHGVVVTAVRDDDVTLRRPLALALGASEPFVGCRISAPIDPAWVSNVANVTEHLDVDAGYILTWSYHTQSGAAITARSTADLVRTPQLARVTPDDVEGRFPGWPAIVERPEDAIDEAFELVRRDARLHRSIRRARHAFALRELAITAANVVAVEQAVMFRGAPKAKLADAEARYHAQLSELVRRASGGLPAAPPPAPVEDEAPPPLSVSHASVIDALMEWVATHPLVVPDHVLQLATLFLPRLRTREERRVAAMFLRAQDLPKKARKLLRERVLRQLADD